jgi:hypothetical protein
VAGPARDVHLDPVHRQPPVTLDRIEQVAGSDTWLRAD